MGFWDLSDNSSAKDTGAEYEVPGGNLEPIPAGSSVLAMIDEAKWDDKDGAEYISLRWSVMAPEQYKNRKIFHKLWASDLEPATVAKGGEAKAVQKRDKARKMLSAIDANAGGKLSRKDEKPSDDALALNLCNKPMVITLMVWESQGRDGTMAQGNWVSAVAPKSKEIKIGVASTAPRQSQSRRDDDFGMSSGQSRQSRVDDDEIPF